MDNINGNFCVLVWEKEFLDTKAQFIKEKKDTFGFIKMKNVCTAKDKIKKMKRHAIAI